MRPFATGRPRRARMFSAMVAVLCLAGGIAAGANALAAHAGSGATVRLGDGPGEASPSIAADGASGLDAVWFGSAGLMAAHRSREAWSAPSRLSSRAQEPGEPAQLAAAPGGSAVITWRTTDGGTVYARYRPGARRRWEPLTTLAPTGRYGPADPEAGIDARGDADVLVDDTLHVHRADARGWSPPRVLRGPGTIVSLAVTPAGTLALLRTRPANGRSSAAPFDPPVREALWLQTRPPSGLVRTFALGDQGGPFLQGDASPFLYRPVLAADARGDILAAWQAPIAPAVWRIRVARLATGARHPTLVTLREPGLDPAIAPGPHRSAVVLWDADRTNDDHDARAAQISDSGHLLDDRVLPGLAAEPAVAFDPRGDVAAIGRTSDRPRVFVLAGGRRWCATRPAGRSSETAIAVADGRPELLSHRSGSPAIVATDEGGCRTGADARSSGSGSAHSDGGA